MNLKDFIEGVEILQKYYKDPNGYHLSAEHDQVYLGSTDRPVAAADVKRLHKLGWFQPDMLDEDGEASPEYDPNDGWSTFV